MKSYRIKSESTSKLTLRVLWIIPLIGIALAWSLYFTSTHFDWFLLSIPLVVMVGIFALFSYVSRKQPGGIWGKYELILNSDSLILKQEGMSDIEIRRDEVTSIVRSLDGTLILKTVNRYKTISVPAQLEDFDEAKTILEQWRPVESASSQRFSQMLTGLSTLIFLTAHYASGWIKDERIIIFADLFFVLTSLQYCIESQRNPYVDKSKKRLIWLIMLPLAFAFFDGLRRLNSP